MPPRCRMRAFLPTPSSYGSTRRQPRPSRLTSGHGSPPSAFAGRFPKQLIARICETFNYEACLLGLLYSDLDPNGVMNVWLSSEPDHQWNPKQKSPATPWETEIDRLMRAQASSGDEHLRKQYWDRVQEIAWE